ncbi:hypothetical protein QBC46DRAFT_379528 [Diplogelasinospora grovesii]|uniref:Rhodopsin domain-containing protein n=1 Tax=Diplogelasinospora grovesii TaxID=303347 RepID=A0AAN6NBB8_9PEZI|nr:hypothetical protein QBC46DRAFT_379528 [Diplogelasinospora grovesii]
MAIGGDMLLWQAWPRDTVTGGPESRAVMIYAVMATFVPLAFTAVCLRLYSRWRFTSIGKDDILIVVAFILYSGLTVATVYGIEFGLGLHVWDVPKETAVLMQKCGFTSQVMYPPMLGVIKVSILLFFIRILPVVHDWKVPLRWFAVFIALEESAFMTALFLQCRPIYYYWDKSTEGTCFNQTAFYYVDGGINMATDLCILLLPWLIFRDLKFSRKTRYSVIALCSAGVFTLISSTLRLPYLLQLNKSSDPTWQVPDVVIWSIAEVGSAISFSSVPAIKPLAMFLYRGLREATSGENTQRKSSGVVASRQRSIGITSNTSHDENPSRLSYIQLDDIDPQPASRLKGIGEQTRSPPP